MGEETGVGPCPECGTTGSHPRQLVCQGCFVPFSLMTPVRRGDGDPDPTEPLPYVDAKDAKEAEGARDAGDAVTRVLDLGAAARPGFGQTRRDAPPRALRLSFPGGEVVSVEPGVCIRLGRDPQFCPAVSFLASHDNLSRIHATVGVEADGSAWIIDEGSTNGTFAHGYRLAANARTAVRPGDTVRLAADLTVRVLL